MLGVRYYILTGLMLGVVFSGVLALSYNGKSSFAESTISELLTTPPVVLITPIAVSLLISILLRRFASNRITNQQYLINAEVGALGFGLGIVFGIVAALVIFFLAPFTVHSFFGHVFYGLLLGGAVGSVIGPFSLKIEEWLHLTEVLENLQQALASIVRNISVISSQQANPALISKHRPQCRDFFLSYKSEDANLVRQVAECLVSNGFTVWFAEYEILLSNYEAFQAAIDDGLVNCKHGILFTNSRYWASSYCQYEAEKLHENLNPEDILDISLTAQTSLSSIISDLSSRTGLNLHYSIPQIFVETTFSARCTEIGFNTGGFCLEQWDNASVDGSDQARFRSLDPDIPLRFNVCFDFNLEYAPGKPYTIATAPVANDRNLYNERRVFAEWWIKEMDKLGARPVEEGLHLVWREQKTHVALTHRFADQWMRKYSLIIDGQGLSRRTEVILTFATKGDFRSFCKATALMDRIVESIHITNESSKTTIEKCKRH